MLGAVDVPPGIEAYESIDPEYKEGSVEVPGEEVGNARGDDIGVFDAELCAEVERRCSCKRRILFVSTLASYARNRTAYFCTARTTVLSVSMVNVPTNSTYKILRNDPIALRNSSAVGSSTCFPTKYKLSSVDIMGCRPSSVTQAKSCSVRAVLCPRSANQP